MARPKGKLFALIAIFAAIGIVTATGAFTSVSATRTVDVNVSGDGAALLALEKHTGPNGAYADFNGNQLSIVVSGNNSNLGQNPKGVNDDAETYIDHVFNITNQGTQKVELNTSQLPEGLYLYTANNRTSQLAKKTVILSIGETKQIGVAIDTKLNGGPTRYDFNQSGTTELTIVANATG